jgi:cellulose synthase/poly-beta-1,6-N-acetylglucosamine synthase-like glycosyltransferase
LTAVTVFLLLFAALSLVIFAFHAAVAAGLVMNMVRDRRLSRDTPAPAVVAEVIVAVRDEEKALPRLLDSLAAQTLPCLFLFVDDGSRDGTARLLDEFCAAVGSRARVVRGGGEPRGLTGKQAALDMAFDQARGDVLLFTDGDCAVPPTWAEEMLCHFRRPAVGVVLGRIELAADRTFLQGFQAFEQPLINQYNLGSAGLGIPTGCFGNNMAARAEAVRATGGFRRLGYSVTEDAMLLDAVCRQGGWKAAACVSPRAAVVTVPKTRWRDYLEQHTRWNAGGLFAADPLTRFFFILVVVVYLVGSLLVMPLGVLDARVPLLSLAAFVSIGLLGVVGGLFGGKRRGQYFLRFLPFLVFFAFFYAFVTLRALARRPFAWKGVVLSPGAGRALSGPRRSLRRTPGTPPR